MTSAADKLDRGRSMAEMWDGFAAHVIPSCPPGTGQYVDMERTFYSGAFCLFNWLMVQLDPADEVTPADMERVDRMDAELRGFFQRRTQ